MVDDGGVVRKGEYRGIEHGCEKMESVKWEVCCCENEK